MKRVIKFLLAALVTLSVCSCKEKEGIYSFRVICASNTSDAKLQACIDIIEEVPYFLEVDHKYTGKYSEVVKLAFRDFSEACKLVNDDAMSAVLEIGDIFRANFIDMTDQAIIGYCYWTADAQSIENEP